MIGKNFDDLVGIIKLLRKECPWDREQTHDTIKAATLEEVYEVIESIDEKKFDELKGELGDILLHIIFHSVIAEENNNFTLDEVITAIKEKLIRRHPHVFGDIKVTDSKEITYNWEKIKLSEGRKSVLDGVPKSLPGLQRASRLQEKASKIGFDWKDKKDVWEKVLEEIKEFKEAEEKNNNEEIEKEIGDVFFSLINYARFIGINPENALRKTSEKFIKRFQYIEEKIEKKGKSITDSDLEEMDFFWNQSKKEIN